MILIEKEIPHKYRNKYLNNTHGGEYSSSNNSNEQNKLNVLDTLESNSAEAALSAKQGKELNENKLSRTTEDSAKEIIDFEKGLRLIGDLINKFIDSSSDLDSSDTAIISAKKLLSTFIRKDEDDNVSGTLIFSKFQKFLDGYITDSFSKAVSGAGLYKDENGDWHLQAEYVQVLKKIIAESVEIQHSSHISGKQIATAAEMICIKVEETDAYYRCYMRTKDALGREIKNCWKTNDLAYCETFNLLKQENGAAGNHFFWRKVINVGSDFIDLSKTDCAEYSDAPLKDDFISQLGYKNTDDSNRQGAIIFAGAGEGAPFFKVFKGINDYSLEGKEIYSQTIDEFFVQADSFKFATGQKVTDYVEEKVSDIPVFTDIEYYVSSSSDSLQDGSWSNSTPLWEKGKYIFMRTKLTQGDTVAYKPDVNGVNIQGAKGENAIQLIIYSSKGDKFVGGNISTTLTAKVYSGETDITNLFQTSDFSWERTSDNADTDAIWNEQHSGYGNTLVLTSSDVFRKALFECLIKK